MFADLQSVGDYKKHSRRFCNKSDGNSLATEFGRRQAVGRPLAGGNGILPGWRYKPLAVDASAACGGNVAVPPAPGLGRGRFVQDVPDAFDQAANELTDNGHRLFPFPEGTTSVQDLAAYLGNIAVLRHGKFAGVDGLVQSGSDQVGHVLGVLGFGGRR